MPAASPSETDRAAARLSITLSQQVCFCSAFFPFHPILASDAAASCSGTHRMNPSPEPSPTQQPSPQRPRNRFDRMEWAGAFGDLGTLIPFVAAYISVVKMDPLGVLLAFGISMVACGWFYRTPFPVQPMKAIGAVVATQAAQVAVLTSASVIASSILTGLIWLILGATGLATTVARLVPRTVVIGIVLGLGMSFMLEGAKMMSTNWPLAAAAFVVAALLRNSRVLPAMFVLLLGGFAYSLVRDPQLVAQLGNISIGLRAPQLTVPTLAWNDMLLGMVYLALPQVPLTLGNAIIGTHEENNRLFPDRPITIRQVAISTGIMNLFSAGVGGVPMCHGAGGMAAHVSFGARTGGSSIILGVVLIILGLAFSDSIELLLQTFPLPVLGVILFLTGTLLATGNLQGITSKATAFIIVATAGMAVWNIAVAFILGLFLHQLHTRGYLDA